MFCGLQIFIQSFIPSWREWADNCCVSIQGLHPSEDTFHGQLRHNAAWRLSQFEGSRSVDRHFRRNHDVRVKHPVRQQDCPRLSHLITADTVNKVPQKDSPSKTSKAGSFEGCRPWIETQQMTEFWFLGESRRSTANWDTLALRILLLVVVLFSVIYSISPTMGNNSLKFSSLQRIKRILNCAWIGKKEKHITNIWKHTIYNHQC